MIMYSSAPPLGPKVGDRWFNPRLGVELMFNGQVWGEPDVPIPPGMEEEAEATIALAKGLGYRLRRRHPRGWEWLIRDPRTRKATICKHYCGSEFEAATAAIVHAGGKT